MIVVAPAVGVVEAAGFVEWAVADNWAVAELVVALAEVEAVGPQGVPIPAMD